MLRIVIASVLVLFAAPAFAQEPPPPRTCAELAEAFRQGGNRALSPQERLDRRGPAGRCWRKPKEKGGEWAGKVGALALGIGAVWLIADAASPGFMPDGLRFAPTLTSGGASGMVVEYSPAGVFGLRFTSETDRRDTTMRLALVLRF